MKPTQSSTVLHTFSTSPKAEILYSQINIFHNTKQSNVSISVKDLNIIYMDFYKLFAAHTGKHTDFFSPSQPKKNRLKKKGTKVPFMQNTGLTNFFENTPPNIHVY